MFGSTKSRHLAIRTFVAAALVFLGRLGPAWSDPPGPASGTAEKRGSADRSDGSSENGKDRAEAEQPKKRDLGPPLVDDMAPLRKLDPDQPVWVDKKHGQVILVGASCQASYALEFFTTLPGREYEAVTVVDVRPSVVHAALVALGAEPGHPARFQPKYEPAEGTEVAIEVRWKDSQGKRQRAAHKTGSETSRPRRH